MLNKLNTKIKLKTKEFALSNFSVNLENKIIKNYDALLPPNLALNPTSIPNSPINKNSSSNIDDKMSLKEYFENQDKELSQLQALSQEINYVNIPLESFEVEVDIVNHISDSGGLDRIQLEIKEK